MKGVEQYRSISGPTERIAINDRARILDSVADETIDVRKAKNLCSGVEDRVGGGRSEPANAVNESLPLLICLGVNFSALASRKRSGALRSKSPMFMVKMSGEKHSAQAKSCRCEQSTQLDGNGLDQGEWG